VAVRQTESRPLVDALRAWLSVEVAKLACGHDFAMAIRYMRKRWLAFMRFLDDGNIVDPLAWLVVVLDCIADHPRSQARRTPLAAPRHEI